MSKTDLLMLYSALAASICAIVALVELVYKYSHSAKLTSIVFNIPSLIFFGLNLGVGALAVLGVSSAEILNFDLSAESPTIPGIFKAILVGFAALAFLRSSFATFSGDEGSTNFGPSALLDKLREILDRKIDLIHKIASDREIAKIMANIDADKARYELPALCLTGIQSCTEEDVVAMRDTIGKLFTGDAIVARPILIGHALYRFCGLDVLRSSIDVLGESIARNNSTPTARDENSQISSLLSTELQRLKGLQ